MYRLSGLINKQFVIPQTVRLISSSSYCVNYDWFDKAKNIVGNENVKILGSGVELVNDTMTRAVVEKAVNLYKVTYKEIIKSNIDEFSNTGPNISITANTGIFQITIKSNGM